MNPKTIPLITLKNAFPPYEDYAYFAGMRSFPFQSMAKVYNPTNAWILAEVATLAYSGPRFAGGRDGYALGGFSVDELINDVDTDTQCYVIQNKDALVIAFRGTQSKLFSKQSMSVFLDFLTNAQALHARLHDGSMVHEGFLRAVHKVQKKINSAVQAAYSSGKQIYYTGHSLGGALAILAAHLYPDPNHLSAIYAYAVPRVGDRRFASVFDQKYAGNTFRFEYDRDIVPKLPPEIFGYQHVGGLRFIDQWGQVGKAVSTPEASLPGAVGRLFSLNFNLIPAELEDHVPLYYCVNLFNDLV